MELKESADKSLKEVLPPVDPSGINTRAVMIFCTALIVIAVVAHLLIWYLFNTFDAYKKSEDPVLSPLAPRQQQLPPEPRLQAAPNTASPNKQFFDPKDVETLKQIANDQLDSYGWVDDKNGIVRIPIKDAMKITVDKEKQTQTAPTEQKNAPSHVQQ